MIEFYSDLPDYTLDPVHISTSVLALYNPEASVNKEPIEDLNALHLPRVAHYVQSEYFKELQLIAYYKFGQNISSEVLETVANSSYDLANFNPESMLFYVRSLISDVFHLNIFNKGDQSSLDFNTPGAKENFRSYSIAKIMTKLIDGLTICCDAHLEGSACRLIQPLQLLFKKSGVPSDFFSKVLTQTVSFRHKPLNLRDEILEELAL
jgi:hypothetical protein